MAEEPETTTTTTTEGGDAPSDTPAPADPQTAAQETEERATIRDLLARHEVLTKDVEGVTKERDEAKAALDKVTAELADAKLAKDLRAENARLRAVLRGQTQGRLNIDAELRHVNMDGVSWEDDGTMKGEPSYRTLPALPSQVVRDEPAPQHRPSAPERALAGVGLNSQPQATTPQGYAAADFGEDFL